MWGLADRVDARIAARRDVHYDMVARRWVEGLRRTWHQQEAQQPVPGWATVPESDIAYPEEDIELTMREYWMLEFQQAMPSSCQGAIRGPESCCDPSHATKDVETKADAARDKEKEPGRPPSPSRRLLSRKEPRESEESSFVINRNLRSEEIPS